MIKIGDFSKLAHISIKTLHHYDEAGLLKPAHIDRYTSYRYYTLDQLSQLNRILALKELGFSLDQVARLLGENLSVAEIRGMLRLKRLELESRLQEETARLTRVENRLRQLENENSPNTREVAIKQIPPLCVLSSKIVAASEEALIPTKESLINILQDSLHRLRIKPTSPWFSLIDNLAYDENNLEIEMAVGIPDRSKDYLSQLGSGPVVYKVLDSVEEMASIIHQDALETLPQTYATLYGWTQLNAYKVAGPCREIYLPKTGILAPPDTSDSLIEVQCPVEQVNIPISIFSNQEGKEKIMEPQILTKPAFKAVGLSYIGMNQAGEIKQMWDVFNRRYPEIKSIDQSCCYGLCFITPVDESDPRSKEPGVFEYVAAAEVAGDQDLPNDMVYREVPEHKYLVFTHHGKLNNLGETYKYIYETWIPQSGYKTHPSKFDMEVYNEDFIMDSDQSRFYIYVAIE